MLPVLQVGPAAIQLPGLILLVGLWIGLAISERYSPRAGVSAKKLYNLVFLMLVAGLVGARLSIALKSPEAFVNNPMSIISLNPGLLDLWGGIFAAVVAGLVFTRKQQIPVSAALDALTPLFAVLMISVSLSNLASGHAYGSPASIPWSIFLWGMPRHPSQVYSFIAASAILAYLWPGRWAFEKKRPGEYFLYFVFLSTCAALFLESFRGDSLLIYGGIRARQLIAWGILASSLVIMQKVRKTALPEN